LQSLPDVNFYQPHDVLRALNESFQMSSQNDKYFTIWYGVYNQTKRQLTYASAGHPPAILRFQTAEGITEVGRLKTPNLPIGMLTEATFVSDRQMVPKDSTLYIFSDGVYDISQTEYQTWGLNEFVDVLVKLETTINLDDVLTTLQQVSGIDTFEDDLSLLRVNFR
jgi:phosphoserine phosphatase RsbU/P